MPKVFNRRNGFLIRRFPSLIIIFILGTSDLMAARPYHIYFDVGTQFCFPAGKMGNNIKTPASGFELGTAFGHDKLPYRLGFDLMLNWVEDHKLHGPFDGYTSYTGKAYATTMQMSYLLYLRRPIKFHRSNFNIDCLVGSNEFYEQFRYKIKSSDSWKYKRLFARLNTVYGLGIGIKIAAWGASNPKIDKIYGDDWAETRISVYYIHGPNVMYVKEGSFQNINNTLTYLPVKTDFNMFYIRFSIGAPFF
jgi:hypothetical protein